MGPSSAVEDALLLSDWRRRVAELYAEVRSTARSDPVAAWRRWRTVRETLFREHPQSPVPPDARAAFVARHFEYEPALRLTAPLLRAPEPTAGPGFSFDAPLGDPARAPVALPSSGATVPPMRRLGSVELPLPGGPESLAVFWLEEYSGGIFLPFRDATSGHETYGAGRYLLDTAKGADLGANPASGALILDFNFAYHPSCAFDPRWSCPLAPPENRMTVPIEAGERLG
jgi:uncharacterized protein